MFRATQPRWIFERLYEQIRAIPSLQFSKYTGLFLEATRAGNSPYSPKVVRSFHVQKASKINKTEEQKKGQRRYNFLHSLTNCTSIGIGLLLGSSTTTTVLTASCEANPDGDVIRLNPWDKEYLSTLVLGSSHKDQITKALRARNGTLNIKGFSDDELRNLANWLKEHYHGFIHLQSDKTQLSNASRTAVKEIETELKKNKDAFQDRSSSQDCADFCVLAYKSLEEIKNSSNLPDGWKVLTCGDNPLVESSKNGYFGIAFVNHKTGNIIIAHRGTEFPNFSSSQNGSSNWLSKINALLELLKDVRADYFGVACLGLDDQQRSAVEFSKKVNDKAKEYNYRVGCVGHSLGGWLAQIAAYTLNDNQNGRGNIYAICLDSPGIKEMITKYYQSKYRMTEEVPLDVVNFTLFPNHVNCFGRHLGTLYQLPLDREILNPQKKINAFDYLMTTHNKEHLRKAIKVSHSEGCFIENWPMIDSVKVSDELANYTTRNTIKASVSTFFDSNNLCEFFTKFCKTGVENVDAGYQAYLQLTEEYRNFRELLSSSNQNDFDRLYRAGYRVKKFDPKVMRICHFDNATRELLVLIQQLRNLGGSEKQMTSFLVEKAKVFGIPSSELLPLLRFQIEKDLLTVDAKGGNAADIRRLACQLLNCFPMETLRKELCEYKYLSFLNDWPQQRVKEILLDDSVSPPTTTYYFESKYSQAIDFIDQMFQESNVVFLYGIPGSGKLEIARCYYDFFINKNSLGKKNIAFFLDASTSEKLEQAWNQISFKQISKIMELSNSTSTQSELFDGVYSTLDSLDEDYLIIFSGVKQPEDLTKYLTQNFLDKKFKGKILVTSEKFSENYSMIDVAEKFPIELNQAYEILKHNNVVDPIVCSLFNTLWNGSSDINNSSKPLRWYQKIIALFVPDSRICEEKAAAKSLKSSPLTVDLVSRYLQNSSLQDSKDFIELLQRTSQQKQILICTIQAIVKALEKDDLTRFLLKTLPLLPHDRISCELIQNWATSNEASMFFSNRQEISRVQNSIQRLEKYGILQPMTGEKADFFYIHPYIYQELKKSFPDKPAYPFLKDNFIDLFFNFISSNMKLENITTDDFRINKKLRIYAEHIINSKINSTNSLYELLKSITLLNKVGNNYLKNDCLSKSFKIFQQSKKMCENLGELHEQEFVDLSKDKQDISLKTLFEKDTKLVDEFAKALYYLGNIHFQKGDRKSALKYFNAAKTIRIALIKQDKNFEENWDWIVVRRQGIGWNLLGSDKKEDWSAAENLYIQLLEEKKNNYDSFHIYYCNLMLARIYCKFAKAKDTKPIDIANYYNKALNRLQDGGFEKEVHFDGALTALVKSSKEYRDPLIETHLEIANILSRPDYPSHDYLKAEEILLNLLEESLKKLDLDIHKENFLYQRKDFLFRTYHRLAVLYKAQVRSHLRDNGSEKNAKLAKSYAEKALQELEAINHDDFEMIAKKREIEIQELEEILI